MHHQSTTPSYTIDFVKLKQQVTISQVLGLIEYRPVSMKGPQLRGPCPIHKSSSERSRSFSVNIEKNAYQCFGCGSKGNQLDLAAEVFGLPLYEAAKELCHRLGIEPPKS